MNWIDTHAHPFMCDRPMNEIISSAQAAGVNRLISVATTLDNAKACIQAADTYPGIVFPTMGIHPLEHETHEWEAQLDAELKTGRYHAVGEIGLDYHWSADTREAQIRKLEIQLGLAQKYRLPAIIHNRKSEADMGAILGQFPTVKKVIHCFSLGVEWVDKWESPTTYYSFTGMITRWEDGELLWALKAVPLDKIMVETDCPYLTPAAHKGEENQPAFVVETARVMAMHKGVSVEELAARTTATAEAFFGLPQ